MILLKDIQGQINDLSLYYPWKLTKRTNRRRFRLPFPLYIYLLYAFYLVGIAVSVVVQVVGDAPVEGVDLQEVGHHSDNGAPLLVGDRVEDLVDLVGHVDRH